MLDGKKGVAQKIVYGAFDKVAEKAEKPAMNYLRKKGFAPVVTKDDQKILKAAAAEIDFMGVNYYQSCVCEYNPMDGVTPYGTMNTTGVKGSAQVLGVPGIYKNPGNPYLITTDWDWSIDPVGLRYCCLNGSCP